MICDDRFMRHTIEHWLFGKDETGQLMEIENIKHIWQELARAFPADDKSEDSGTEVDDGAETGNVMGLGKGMGMDIVTADGSLDSTRAPNEQESITAPLVYAEVFLLHCLSRFVNLITKTVTILRL